MSYVKSVELGAHERSGLRALVIQPEADFRDVGDDALHALMTCRASLIVTPSFFSRIVWVVSIRSLVLQNLGVLFPR